MCTTMKIATSLHIPHIPRVPDIPDVRDARDVREEEFAGRSAWPSVF
ncbi:hypothetical protein WDU96_08680 [Microbacterium sp. Mu-86]|uniref:Uncharacterized protein n=1 Tax=Microbacterium marmarense TaxID=3122051 RepID=A0ABU8LV68_9MICO